MPERPILILSLLLLISFSVMGQSAPYDHQQYIEWNEFYPLSWDNFKGEPTENSIGDAGTAVKIMATPYYAGKKIRYNVYALFNMQKSWGLEKDSALLAHEQLHFNIAELYARKIRKKVAELNVSGAKSLSFYNAEINKLLEESNAVDIQYDLETLHGAIRDKQRLWQKKIDAEMKALAGFKKPAHTIGRK